MKRSIAATLLTSIITVLAVPCFSQDTATLLQRVKTANVRGALPQDVTISGTLTDDSGNTQPIQMQIKGKDKIRTEIGTGKTRRITIFNGNQGWTQVGDQLQALPQHASVRRPSLIPMLDLLSEIDSPQLIAADRGLKAIGQQNARQISLTLPDPATVRAFGRKLDENLEVFIDPVSMLVVRTERLNRSMENMDFLIPSVLEFSDYRVVGNLAVAFRIVNTTGTPDIGMHQKIMVISQVQLNTSIPDSAFLPGGAQ